MEVKCKIFLSDDWKSHLTLQDYMWPLRFVSLKQKNKNLHYSLEETILIRIYRETIIELNHLFCASYPSVSLLPEDL